MNCSTTCLSAESPLYEWLNKRSQSRLEPYICNSVTDRALSPFCDERAWLLVDIEIRNEFKAATDINIDVVWKTLETSHGYRFRVPVVFPGPIRISCPNMHITYLPPVFCGLVCTVNGLAAAIRSGAISGADRDHLNALKNGLVRFAELHPDFEELWQCIETV